GPDQHLPQFRAKHRGGVHLLQVRLRHRVCRRHHAPRRRSGAGRPAGTERRRQAAGHQRPTADHGRPSPHGHRRPGIDGLPAQPGEQRLHLPRPGHPSRGRHAVRRALCRGHGARAPPGDVLGGLLRLPGRQVRRPLDGQLHEPVV
ncbi:MAG: PhnB protein; putative DNA binding 3-demethylubiquinone-9 3-methyltransferase domain protein, partial [uncultured Thermomicrobiales bacterium]